MYYTILGYVIYNNQPDAAGQRLVHVHEGDQTPVIPRNRNHTDSSSNNNNSNKNKYTKK